MGQLEGQNDNNNNNLPSSSSTAGTTRRSPSPKHDPNVKEQRADSEHSTNTNIPKEDTVKNQNIGEAPIPKHQPTLSSLPFDHRRWILKDLDIDQEVIANIHSFDDETFNKYLSIILEKERKNIEKIKETNLNTLNQIIDKCIQSDDFNARTIENLVEFVASDPKKVKNIPKIPSLTPNKRSRTGSMSPRGHHKSISEIPSNISSQQQTASWFPPQQFQPYQPHISQPYGYFDQNQQMNTDYGNQQRPGLPGPPPQQYLPYQQYQPQQQPQQQQQQQQPFPPHFSSQSNQNFPSQSSNLPGTASTFSQPSSFLQVPHNNQQRFSLIRERLPDESLEHDLSKRPLTNTTTLLGRPPKLNATMRRQQGGHRRSRSAATVLPQISRNNSIGGSMRSPNQSSNNNSNRTPQKPVSFLIHTPKHPPPT
ncbi:uncharacterized protein NDAI_0D01010 [Naumovozyma dairenensis CBS 421]|uniref:Uncharacterized protein n=1 Tax=Naumovozyma dairenensis (strain ATCC 10597 / BCRC 20456 / CBS 421 / NBRC 0211 / NRRL Y-12639) TaxID=1071378 RepID=G0W9F3_NAUDC|nr:hypothetical protein NDAI_0D01010 [Naumovozyma dairenensis CBS 421]CCD24414.1 hypothetical protein NDAI_0D01010 [Naumovozyma dairenensis CBS 421]